MKTLGWICLLFVSLLSKGTPSPNLCPKQCECDLVEDLRRATCTNGHIADINLNIPKYAQIIDFSHNSINEITDYGFKKLGFKSLTKLYLSYNKIYWIGIHGFAGLDSLMELDLSYNGLEAIHNELFYYNSNLEVLDLSGNKFLSFRNEPFIIHDHIKKLNLSNSRISFLPDHSFERIPNLMELDISGNNLIQLQMKTISPCTLLSKFHMERNEWHCNNIMESLHKWLSLKHIIHIPQCKYGNNKNKMEKLIMIDLDDQNKIEETDQDLDEIWNINEILSTTEPTQKEEDDKMSIIQLFNSKVPPIFSLLVGFEIGILIGVAGTYCWMAKIFKLKSLRFSRRSFSHRTSRTNEGTDRLLMNASVNDSSATPPASRRNQPFSRSFSWHASGFNRNNSVSRTSESIINERPDTPPPAYNDALNDVVLPC